MRFGLIGCGWIVERDHIPAMLQSERVDIVAVADVSPERARLAGRIAGLPESACLTDYRALMDRSDVDIVSVASPPGTRLKIVRDAAAAGKHIVCEKPFALSLNKYVSGSSAPAFWTGMPAGVQAISTINGQVYAVNAGNNDSAILYNKPMLEKAGIGMPWQPKTWQDIVTAALAVKKHDPGVWPLWMAAGVAAEPTNVLQGIGNLIDGSTNPVMFDTKTNKWVVNSPGLRATLQLYKTIFQEGLNAPTSQLFRTDSVGQPPLLMKQGKLAISIGSNWYPTVWVQSNSAAPWPQGAKDVGVAPIPTENGQAPGGASTIGGWAYAISKASSNDTMAWNFIKLTQDPQNQLTTALWSGFVPPDLSVGQQGPFVSYAPPFQAAFNEYSKYGVPLPNNANFTVYARALNTVTGDFAQNPNLSISSALSTMSGLITQQLGSSSVESQS